MYGREVANSSTSLCIGFAMQIMLDYSVIVADCPFQQLQLLNCVHRISD